MMAIANVIRKIITRAGFLKVSMNVRRPILPDLTAEKGSDENHKKVVGSSL